MADKGTHLAGSVLALLLSLTLVGQARAEFWTQLSPSGGPPSARERHTAVYDVNSNRMIVFGGRDAGFNAIGDLWTLENANGLGGAPNWMQLSPTGGPPTGRILHTAVYDANSNRMVMFGGRDAGGTTGDVWLLEHANGLGGTPNWTQLSPTGGPPGARYRHAAVYDSNSNRMMVFAGAVSGSPPYANDVWVLDHANGLGGTPNWTQLSPTGGPPGGRSATSAVYDPDTNRMIVFGGWDCAPGCQPTYNDAWVLEHANGLGGTANWIQLTPTGGPPTPRTEHTSVYDPNGNRMIVFGGDDVSGILDELWVLDHANGLGGTPNWRQLSPTGGPPAGRILHTAVYEPNTNRMTVFGGSDGPSSRLNDVWVLAPVTSAAAAPLVSAQGLALLALLLAFAGLFGVARLRARERRSPVLVSHRFARPDGS